MVLDPITTEFASPDLFAYTCAWDKGASMQERFRRAFFAFPAQPSDLVGTITSATGFVARTSDRVAVTPWPEMDIFGTALADEVRNEIAEADVLVCDITRSNPNVYYEIGYAIGLGKPIAPVINSSFALATQEVVKDGFFDGVGFKAYENSEQLARILVELPSHSLLDLYGKSVNFQQPLYVLDAYRKTDFRNAIVSAVKDSGVFYRSFDPVEVPRFSTIMVIAEATSSAGLIIPLVAPHLDDAMRHNLRAAFLAGIGHGLGRQTLLLQREHFTVPADYREQVQSISSEAEISEAVSSFSKTAYLSAQSISAVEPASSKSALQQLRLGSSSAENEFRTLELYFVETAEYARTIRGETRIVAGRKGAGKTAIFFRVRDYFRTTRTAVIADLKPESHQLSLFREELLKVTGAGVFDHTLAAFWYFVLLAELLLKIRSVQQARSNRDNRALEAVLEIDRVLGRVGVYDSGDFTSRINRLGLVIVDELKRMKVEGVEPTPQSMTNIIFRDGVSQVRNLVRRFTAEEGQTILLFDNLDKGWPAQGVHEFDIRLVRLLVEALDKIRHEFESDHREFMSVVFLRNDIYELLVGQTPDRGKAGQIRIDWTDRAKLKQVIYRRLVASTKERGLTFDQIWSRFFVTEVRGRDSFDYFVDHCLMRPRFLINIIEYAIANGINRNHARVQEDDCIDAVRQHSLYLVNDFGYEIRDVSGLPPEILYSLVGTTKLLTRGEAIARFEKFGVAEADLDNAFHLLLWYGVLGIALATGAEHFIYDYDYDIKRLEAEIRSSPDEVLYVTNAALHVALSS